MLESSPLAQLTRVRFLSFAREPEAVFWTFVFPVVLALILGWAFREADPVPGSVGVVIPGGDIPAAFLGSAAAQTLSLDGYADIDNARRDLARGKLDAVLVMAAGTEPRRVLLDPAHPEAELTRLRLAAALRLPRDGPPAFEIETVAQRGTRYIDWLFPGLIGMNLMSTGLWSIGFAIADMRQKKLLRRFLVTPMRRSAFLASFVCSRFLFLVIELALLLAFALLIFGVPLQGSLLTFAVIGLAGTLCFAATGVLLAARARTMEGITGLMNLFMVPMWLFSGVFFSYQRYPEAVHPFIKLLPLTALNDGLRAIMLEGAALTALLPELAVLLGWIVLPLAIGLRVFRWE
ncbi:MAG: ABC transporter permease [Gammaproteobacteria bacterium]|nr:ABC transporter permease [Gammaproteobacteria bacterium]